MTTGCLHACEAVSRCSHMHVLTLPNCAYTGILLYVACFICSLVNMYKELETDIEGFKRPDHGCLIGWAKQGKPLL